MANTNINIRYGTLAEWNASDKDKTDITFLTDVPVIKCMGQTYGGNGVPTWDGESRAYADPTKLFAQMYRCLKKPMYLCDENCPKFDIMINQEWTTKYNNGTRTDQWDVSTKKHLYKMIYDDARTEYAHFTNQKFGASVVFKFPVIAGTSFCIYPCSETDWLAPNGDHDRMDPAWDNDTNAYKKEYGASNIDPNQTTDIFAKEDGSISCKSDGYVMVTHSFGNVEMNQSKTMYYPKVLISFASN